MDAGIDTQLIWSRLLKASQLDTPGPQNSVMQINCLKLYANSGLLNHDNVPPIQYIFYYVPNGESFLWPQ